MPVLRQAVLGLYERDAIGNFVRAVDARARSRGLSGMIYAAGHDASLAVAGDYEDFFRDFRPHDILLYHLSNEDPELKRFMRCPGRRVLYYHNMTPASFFRPYAPELADRLDRGRQSLFLARGADAVFANSAWSLAEIAPFLSPWAAHGVMPPMTEAMLDAVAAMSAAPSPDACGFPYLLTVGRVMPHKNIAWGLRMFESLHRHIPGLRYVIMGDNGGMDGYGAEIRHYADALNAGAGRVVLFTGGLDEAEAARWFAHAACLLCVSLHEGFCAPLAEAMALGVPVAARQQPAVAETLAGCGFPLTGATPEEDAANLARMLLDPHARPSIAAAQKKRLGALRAAIRDSVFWDSIQPD